MRWHVSSIIISGSYVLHHYLGDPLHAGEIDIFVQRMVVAHKIEYLYRQIVAWPLRLRLGVCGPIPYCTALDERDVMQDVSGTPESLWDDALSRFMLSLHTEDPTVAAVLSVLADTWTHVPASYGRTTFAVKQS